MATVLMIIAPERFRDEELFITKEELEKKKREAKIRDIQGSSNVTALEDYAKDTDPEVVKVAKARLVELFGDDESESGSTVGIGLQ